MKVKDLRVDETYAATDPNGVEHFLVYKGCRVRDTDAKANQKDALSVGPKRRHLFVEKDDTKGYLLRAAYVHRAVRPLKEPAKNPYHELAEFLQKGGTEAYKSFERALGRVKGRTNEGTAEAFRRS